MSNSRQTEPVEGRASSISERFMMLIGGVMVSITLVALAPVLPQIETALTHNDTDKLLVKLLVTITGATMVIGAPIAGFLVDRIGARFVMMSAALIFAIAGTAGLYLSDLPSLLVSRLFVGLAASAGAATSMALINGSQNEAGRAKWMGLHVAVATVSSLIMNPLAGGLGEFGWRWPFLLFAFGLPIFLFSLAMPHIEMRRTVEVEDEKSGVGLLQWFPFRFMVIALIMGSVTYLPMVYLPFVLREAGFSSPLLISLVGLGDALIATGMALQFARARRRFASIPLFAFSFGCACIGLSIAALSPAVWGVVAGMVIYGFGLGWFVPNLMTAAAACVEQQQQGRTVGLVKAGHYLAAPVAVIAVDPIARAAGPQGGMLTAGVLAALLFLYFLSQLARSRKASASAQPA